LEPVFIVNGALQDLLCMYVCKGWAKKVSVHIFAITYLKISNVHPVRFF